jgi:CheY-like chemotaxis protein
MDAQATRSFRILVVDDHQDTVAILERILTKDGHAVKTAEGYYEAVALAQGERFDLLVTDIGLPERDGCELLAEIRAHYPIRAIALTGYGMADEVKRIREAGFDECLLKPSGLERLRSAVRGLDTELLPFEPKPDPQSALASTLPLPY